MGNFNLQQQRHVQLMTSDVSCNAFKHACVKEMETVGIIACRDCVKYRWLVAEGAETDA